MDTTLISLIIQTALVVFPIIGTFVWYTIKAVQSLALRLQEDEHRILVLEQKISQMEQLHQEIAVAIVDIKVSLARLEALMTRRREE